MSGYSDQEIEAIAGWLKQELSATQIADRFFAAFRRRVTRSAICGVVHRNKVLKAIGLAQKPVAQAPKRPRRPQPETAPRVKAEVREPVTTAEARAYDAQTLALPLAALADGCRFPVNEAADATGHLFCGLRRADKSSYCRHHFLRATGAGTVSEQHAARALMRLSARAA